LSGKWTPWRCSHPGAVDHPQHEAGGSARAVEGRTNFIDRQHDRKTLGRLRLLHAVEPGQFDAEHFAVEEEHGRLRLVLGGSRHLADNRQVGQESLHLGAAHFLRVAFAMMEDKAPHPIRIRFLGADAIVLETDLVA